MKDNIIISGIITLIACLILAVVVGIGKVSKSNEDRYKKIQANNHIEQVRLTSNMIRTIDLEYKIACYRAGSGISCVKWGD